MTTTCQICGRAIKASTGAIAHHGYRQPWGDGQRTASCPGSRRPPYEVGRDAIPPVRANYEKQRTLTEERLRSLVDQPPETLEAVRHDAYGNLLSKTTLQRPDRFDPADRHRSYQLIAYDTEYHARLRTLRADLAALAEAVAFLDERYAGWRAAA